MPGREVTLPALRQRSHGRSGAKGGQRFSFRCGSSMRHVWLCARLCLVPYMPTAGESRLVPWLSWPCTATSVGARPLHGQDARVTAAMRISRAVLVSRAEPQRRRVSTVGATPKANNVLVSVRTSAPRRLCARLSFVPSMLTTGELRLVPWLSWPCTATRVDARPLHGQDARGTAAMKEFLERF